MEDFLEEIYREADLYWQIKQAAECAMMRDERSALRRAEELLPGLYGLCGRYEAQDPGKGSALRQQVQDLEQAAGDFVRMGDILEYRILPLFVESMRQWGDIRTENAEGDYLFASAASGFLTLKNLRRKCYIHSTADPMWEARKLAASIYDPSKKRYALRGCGLGYFAYQLYELSGGFISIQIFETDARMAEYARRYGVLDWIPEDRLEVIVDADPVPFLESASDEEAGFHIFAPMFDDEPEDTQAVMEELDIQFRSHFKHREEIRINYWNNVRSNGRPVAEFDASRCKKEVIIAAGGPSLDDNMDFLRENLGKMTLIAVGTVFRKLVKADIVPDIVVILESDPVVYGQMEGLEDQQVPLLLANTTYWKCAAAYQGEKYFFSIPGLSESLGYPVEVREEAWITGGTVTYSALDAAIRFGAKTIYLAGVDMAYPGGVTHAKGTQQRRVLDTEHMAAIESADGGTVYADAVFVMYRKCIEERIAEAPQVTYYNLSRVGAKIKGTIPYTGVKCADAAHADVPDADARNTDIH